MAASDTPSYCYRQPTLKEATEWLMKAKTLEYRRIQLKAWREEYGDAFADTVEKSVREAWKAKKK